MISAMAVLSLSICTSCVKQVSDADAETLSEKDTESDTGSKGEDIPSLQEIASYTYDQLIDLSRKVDENMLKEAWGEPYISDFQRVWKYELDGDTGYVEADVLEGKVESLNHSVPMYAVVVKKQNGVTYCFLDWSDYIIDKKKLCFMPEADLYGNAIECEVGDRVLLKCNGIVMESYPAQINLPYEAVPTGRVTEDELNKINSMMEGEPFGEDQTEFLDPGTEVSADGVNGRIELKVPATWNWEVANDDRKLQTGTLGSYGIILKPNEAKEGQIEVFCTKSFGLCGTGLVSNKTTLAGNPVWVHTNDGNKHWDYVVFEGDPPQIIVCHTDCSTWTDEMWDEAWSILDTISYDSTKKEGGSGQYSQEAECEELALSMTVHNVTPSGCTVVFHQHEKKKGEMNYGDPYSIEKLDGDEWVQLPYIIDNAAFHLVAYPIPYEGEAEMDVDWEWLYGKLEPGTYRIVKTVDYREEEGTEYLSYPLSAQFVIEGE